ncbi:MAG TPA: M48 family metallopeptidase [Pyrinomonadaceae bacterium]|nr:M48 family metallopeptidase [Pyrinomonadaceae bacterium]
MRKYNLGKHFAAFALIWSMFMLPIAVMGQTRIQMSKNKYSVQDDVKLGREVAREVEQQFPILNDYEVTRYVQNVGQRLVNAIPSPYRQPAFDYQFRVVNARDINAFALPGGPMYVNRGMIEAAGSEGEMAGVMAHEISHVALRHATAQQTKMNKPLNQILGIGAVLGGAILGGQTGAAIGQTLAAGYFLRYSREYEREADILGAQIMAGAGYDPRDLANMFRTIEQQSGGSRAPEWLSSHPDPGSRYQNINREAQLLRVSPSNAIQDTRAFQQVQRRLGQMGPAMSMQEIEQNAQRRGNTQGQSTISTGRYENNVQYPSTRMQTYSSGNWIQFNYPSNWRVMETQDSVWLAPDGAHGSSGITHGALVGVAQTRTNDLGQATQDYVSGVLQANNYLRQQSNFSRTTVGNRQGLTITLAGRSPITGRNEVATVFTTQLRNGSLFYMVMVAPENEMSRYSNAFNNMLRSIRLNG